MPSTEDMCPSEQRNMPPFETLSLQRSGEWEEGAHDTQWIRHGVCQLLSKRGEGIVQIA
jgi:hypothetical protein